MGNPANNAARMDDGFSTLVTFASDTDINLWIKGVTPPSISGGGGIATTTMHNTAYRTMWPKQLKSVDQMQFRAAYSPGTYPSLLSMVNVLQLITITFPAGDSIDVWGFLDSIAPAELQEGAQPEMTGTIIFANQNASKVETGPSYVGTTTTTTTAP